MECDKCKGTGEIIVLGDVYFGEPKEMPDTCPNCKGTGLATSKPREDV